MDRKAILNLLSRMIPNISKINDSQIQDMYNQLKMRLDEEKKGIPQEELAEFQKAYSVLDNFVNLIQDSTTRKSIQEQGISRSKFIEMYGERILGDSKRKYNMTDLYNDIYSSNLTSYRSTNGEEFKFDDSNGSKVTIQVVGYLKIKQWNGIDDSITRYRITKTNTDGNTSEHYVYSHIIISEMNPERNPEYTNAVLNELLGENNIEFSKTSGYIGEIIDNTSNLKEHPNGTEIQTNENYIYKLGDNYSIHYDANILTNVMDYERKVELEKNSKVTNIHEFKKSKHKESDTLDGVSSGHEVR